MNEIDGFVIQALKEDLGRGDLFAAIAPSYIANAFIFAKEDGVFSGEIYIKALAKYTDIDIISIYEDSKHFARGECLCQLRGDCVKLLQIERVMLNIIAHSSGIATLVNRYVSLIQHLPVRLLDTRKTRPLLRCLEKYSVRNGGGSNHRFGLDNMLMLKDTHLACIKDLQSAVSKARQILPFGTTIEVECENIAQVKDAIKANVDIIMCDNMDLKSISDAVAYRNKHARHILLEASGNITLDNIMSYAKSGVDAISVGSLIHQAKWLDVNMKILESH